MSQNHVILAVLLWATGFDIPGSFNKGDRMFVLDQLNHSQQHETINASCSPRDIGSRASKPAPSLDINMEGAEACA